jgi:hypothetical protein
MRINKAKILDILTQATSNTDIPSSSSSTSPSSSSSTITSNGFYSPFTSQQLFNHEDFYDRKSDTLLSNNYNQFCVPQYQPEQKIVAQSFGRPIIKKKL